MAFDIALTANIVADSPTRIGEIRIGSFSERFEASLEFWKPNDYREHWYQSVLRVVNQREDSCLITSITEPSTANFLFWWPIYVLNHDEAVLQQQLLFMDKREKAFQPANPHLSLQPREAHSVDGEKISEWRTSIDALEVWLSSHA